MYTLQTDRVLSIRAYVIRRDSTNKPIKINRVPIGNRASYPGGCVGGGRPTPRELIAINHNVTRVYLPTYYAFPRAAADRDGSA